MKKLLIIAIILIYSANLFSLEYKPLLVDGNKWNYLQIRYPTCGPGCPPIEFTNSYQLGKDTVINTIVYKSVNKTEKTYYDPGYTHYAGAIREDIANQKVYFIERETTTENIIYSFNVNIDDVVISTNGGKNTSIVTAVGTYDFNGTIGKKITIQTKVSGDLISEEYWYEGIGSSIHFTNPVHYNIREDELVLLCVYNNVNLIYDSNLRPNCEGSIPENLSELNSASAINIFPNPTNGLLKIETLLDIEQIEVYDLVGKLALHTSALELNLSGLDNGVYFMTIYLKSGDRIQKKIIKKS